MRAIRGCAELPGDLQAFSLLAANSRSSDLWRPPDCVKALATRELVDLRGRITDEGSGGALGSAASLAAVARIVAYIAFAATATNGPVWRWGSGALERV